MTAGRPAAAAADRLHLFGVRHHGPGCAASLDRALDALDPEVVLVEGPPEGTDLLAFAARGLVPPVALLVHAADKPANALFYPLAEWSPEWRAIRWASRRGRAVRLVDLPAAHKLARADEPAPDDVDATSDDDSTAPEEAAPDEAELVDRPPFDALGELAKAAGYDDGEAWWGALVEEGAPAPELFAHVEAAMTALRHSFPEGANRPLEAEREAAMRLAIKDALATSTGAVAGVFGAWHVPALRHDVPAKQDKALLSGLPKTKVASTWVPWSLQRLATATGYGAGVSAPGWYATVWDATDAEADRLAMRWQVSVARALRSHRVESSTAEVIDAVRLSMALSSMRGLARPGLDELRDAALATLCHGEPARWLLIEHDVLVGSRVGEVPDDVPQMPLAADLLRWQKKLRLKPEATDREVSLDLRTEPGRQKSVLFQRLGAIAVPWARPADVGSSRGTFRENWVIKWDPEHSIKLAEALRWGATIEAAAAGALTETLATTDALDALVGVVQRALNADLPEVAAAGVATLEIKAASASDAGLLARAVPPLVDIVRYGTARSVATDGGSGRSHGSTDGLLSLARSLAARVAIGLGLAARGLDATASAALRDVLIAYDRALPLLDDGAHVPAYDEALAHLVDDREGAALVRGFAARRLLDRQRLADDAVARHLAKALSPGTPLPDAAAWLEGFLGDAAHVLLHDPHLLGLVDAWLASLAEDDLLAALPLFRRATAGFSRHDRQQLLDGVAGRRPAAAGAGPVDVSDAFAEGEALLDRILGLDAPTEPGAA